MKYYGRISTANSLTHYGKKGMKWKHHNKLQYDQEAMNNYEEMAKARGEETGVASAYTDGKGTTVTNYKDGRKSVSTQKGSQVTTVTKNKNYQKYEQDKQAVKRDWKMLTKGGSTKSKVTAGKDLVKDGFKAVKHRVTGSKKKSVMNYG